MWHLGFLPPLTLTLAPISSQLSPTAFFLILLCAARFPATGDQFRPSTTTIFSPSFILDTIIATFLSFSAVGYKAHPLPSGSPLVPPQTSSEPLRRLQPPSCVAAATAAELVPSRARAATLCYATSAAPRPPSPPPYRSERRPAAFSQWSQPSSWPLKKLRARAHLCKLELIPHRLLSPASARIDLPSLAALFYHWRSCHRAATG